MKQINLLALLLISAVVTALGTDIQHTISAYSTVTCTGPCVVNGDLSLYPGSAVTGFPPGIAGNMNIGDTSAQKTVADIHVLVQELEAQSCDVSLSAVTDYGGLTLSPGVYCLGQSLAISGTLYLNCGNTTANGTASTFTFKIGTTLTTETASSVVLQGTNKCDVYWRVGSSATLGSGSDFTGTIIAEQSITLNTAAIVKGKLFARNGAVTLDSNVITPPKVVQSNETATVTPTPIPSNTPSPTPTTTAAATTTTTTAMPTTTTTTAAPTTTTPPTTTTAMPTTTTTTTRSPTTTTAPTPTPSTPNDSTNISGKNNAQSNDANQAIYSFYLVCLVVAFACSL